MPPDLALLALSLGDCEQPANDSKIRVQVASAEPATSVGIKIISADDHEPKSVCRNLLAAALIVDAPLLTARTADRIASVHDRYWAVMLVFVVLQDQPVARVVGVDWQAAPTTGAARVAQQPVKEILSQTPFAKQLVYQGRHVRLVAVGARSASSRLPDRDHVLRRVPGKALAVVRSRSIRSSSSWTHNVPACSRDPRRPSYTAACSPDRSRRRSGTGLGVLLQSFVERMVPSKTTMHVFLSHNHRDKAVVNQVAAQLRLVGVDVWLDDWEIKPGDSIPIKVNEALTAVDTVLVFWSRNAAASRWVNSELAAALARHLTDGSVRVIPIRLDDTELPALLQPLKWLSLDDRDVMRIVREITGIASDADLIKAIQQTIDDSGLDYRDFPGYGIAVGCPRCGAPSGELKGWSNVDYRRDDVYAGIRCARCGWEAGGEI